MNWNLIKGKYPVTGKAAFDYCSIKPFNRNVYDYFDSRRLFLSIVWDNEERNFHGFIFDNFQLCFKFFAQTRQEVETRCFFECFDILEKF